MPPARQVKITLPNRPTRGALIEKSHRPNGVDKGRDRRAYRIHAIAHCYHKTFLTSCRLLLSCKRTICAAVHLSMEGPVTSIIKIQVPITYEKRIPCRCWSRHRRNKGRGRSGGRQRRHSRAKQDADADRWCAIERFSRRFNSDSRAFLRRFFSKSY